MILAYYQEKKFQKKSYHKNPPVFLFLFIFPQNKWEKVGFFLNQLICYFVGKIRQIFNTRKLKGEKKKKKTPGTHMLTDHLPIIIGTKDQPKITHILLVAIWIFFSKEKVKGWRNGRDGGGGEGVAQPPNFLFFQTDVTYSLT
jgi:hypothetical protein